MGDRASVAAAAAEVERSLRRTVDGVNLRSFDSTAAWTTLLRLNGAAVADAGLWSSIVRTRARVLLRLCLQQQTTARQLTYLQPCIGAWVALKDVDGQLSSREFMHVWEHALSLELAASARGNAVDFQQVIQMLQECIKRVEPLHTVYVDYVRTLCRYGEALNKHTTAPTARMTQLRCLAQACAVSLALLETHFDPSACASLGYDKYGIVLPAYNDRMSFADAMLSQAMAAGAYSAGFTARGALEEDWECMRTAAPVTSAGLSELSAGARCGEEEASAASRVAPENILRFRVALLAAKALWMLLSAGGDLDLIRTECNKILRWLNSVTSLPIAEPSACEQSSVAPARAQLWQVMFGCFMLARDCAPEPMAAADVALDLHDASLEFTVAHAVLPLRPAGGEASTAACPSLRAGPGMAPALLRMLHAQRSGRRRTMDSGSIASSDDCITSLRTSMDDVSPIMEDGPFTASAAGSKRSRTNAIITSPTITNGYSAPLPRGDASTVTDASITSSSSSFSIAACSPAPVYSLAARSFSPPPQAPPTPAATMEDTASALCNIMERHMSIASPGGAVRHGTSSDACDRGADAMDLDADTPCVPVKSRRMPPAARRLAENLIVMLDNDAFTLERALASFGVYRTATGFVDMAGPDAGVAGEDAPLAAAAASPVNSMSVASTHAFCGSPRPSAEAQSARKRGRFDDAAAAGVEPVTPIVDVPPEASPTRLPPCAARMDLDDEAAGVSPPRPPTSSAAIGSPLRTTAFKTRSPGATVAAVAAMPREPPPVPSLARSLTFEDGDDDVVTAVPTPTPASPSLPSTMRASIKRSSSMSSGHSSSRPRLRVRWSPQVMLSEGSRRRQRIASFDEFVYGADGIALSCPVVEDAGDGYITACTVAQPAFTPILPAGPLTGLPASGRAVATLPGAWPLRVPSARCVPSAPPAHSPLSPSFMFRVWQLRCALEPHPRDSGDATAPCSPALLSLASPVWTGGTMLPPSPLLQSLSSRLSECESASVSPRATVAVPQPIALIDNDDSRDAVVIALKRAFQAAIGELDTFVEDACL